MSKEVVRYKNLGNNYFKKYDWENAIKCYTKAIEIDPSYIIAYSNRSQAAINNCDYENAVQDGKKCIELDPQFLKGYHRTCNSLYNLEKYSECSKVLKKAFSNGFRMNNDLAAIKKRVDNKLTKIRENKRKTMLLYESLKLDGNELVKQSKYNDAIIVYTKALQCPNITDSIRVDCLNNRALCYQQHSDYRNIIADCTEVLEISPNNIKALFRRSSALEASEKYRTALDDIRKVLAINPKWEAANRAQHRLGKTVRQLKTGF